MTFALLAKVNEAVLIQMQIMESEAIGSKMAAEIIDDILRGGMRERACKYEARPI
jgi:hypothetical protein